MPLEAYATLQKTCLDFTQHAKCCSVEWNYLKIMHADNAT